MSRPMQKTAAKPPRDGLSETDVYAWSCEQAKLLREQRWDELDLDHVAEEIAGVGVSQKREIRSRLKVVMTHLLKGKCQLGLRAASWRRTLIEQRHEQLEVLKDNPSLKRYPTRVYLNQYLGARLAAEEQTGIAFELFPEQCPFTSEEILDVHFMPEAPGDIEARKA